MARDFETLYYEQRALHTEARGMLEAERDAWKAKAVEAQCDAAATRALDNFALTNAPTVSVRAIGPLLAIAARSTDKPNEMTFIFDREWEPEEMAAIWKKINGGHSLGNDGDSLSLPRFPSDELLDAWLATLRAQEWLGLSRADMRQLHGALLDAMLIVPSQWQVKLSTDAVAQTAGDTQAPPPAGAVEQPGRERLEVRSLPASTPSSDDAAGVAK